MRRTFASLRLAPALWFILAVLAGAGLERWHRFRLGAWMGPTRVPVALVLASAALLTGLWTLALFRRHRTTTLPFGTPATLITTGPFRFTRNPLYAAGLVFQVALGLLSDSGWVSLAAIALFLALDRRVVPYEESRLRRLFGPSFERYAARVRRWC